MNRNSSGRRYDREFKNNAVTLVRGGRTITETLQRICRSKVGSGMCRPSLSAGSLSVDATTL